MICFGEMEEISLLKRCGHPVHDECLIMYLRDCQGSPEMITKCLQCRATLKAPDFSYVLFKYRNEFTEELYKKFKLRSTEILIADLDPEDMEGSDLSY